MKNPLQPQHCARMLGALAAPERLKIIAFLRDGPRNVTEIAQTLGTLAVNVSHHLGVLRHAGIIQGDKRGRFIYYSLTPGFLEMEKKSGKDYLDLGCCRLECRLELPPDHESTS